MALGTRELLLKETETLLRTRGYAAFSYADLSEKVGIRKASIHHHFPTKEALGAALIDAYLEQFQAELAQLLEDNDSARARLTKYADLFVVGMKDGMMPLCGALSAENFVLPPGLQARVEDFFLIHLDWLQRVVRDGKKTGELRADLKPKQAALSMLSTLQGASLVAWALKDAKLIKPTTAESIENLMA